MLQTARLTVGIDEVADRGDGVVVRSEAVIHPPNEDLVDRRAYDVAIQVSDVGGRLHLTIDRNGQPLTVWLDDLDPPITRIIDGLKHAANHWDHAKPMFAQPVFRQSLYSLAAAGSELEQHLREQCGTGIDGWERIHLVPSTKKFFPLEYAYDGLPPQPDAAACPNLLGALDRGSCQHAMEAAGGTLPCPNQRDTSFLCPMHFWGFRKLIERNGTVALPEPTLPGDLYATADLRAKQTGVLQGQFAAVCREQPRIPVCARRSVAGSGANEADQSARPFLTRDGVRRIRLEAVARARRKAT